MVGEADDRPARPQARDRGGGAAGVASARGSPRRRAPRRGRTRRSTSRGRRSACRRPRASGGGSRIDGSTARAIRSIVCDGLDGIAPTAVSAESITAEVPSRIAFATSLASARVGSACSIIDSSICVAVITGLPRSRQRRMIRFCISGTVAAPISTPRSPRATISGVGLGEHLVERVDRLGLLDLGDHLRRRAVRAISSLSSRTSSAAARRRARRSRRRSRARSRGRRDPSRSATEPGSATPGRLTPLWDADLAADDDEAAGTSLVDVLDREPDEAVVDQHVVAGPQHLR